MARVFKLFYLIFIFNIFVFSTNIFSNSCETLLAEGHPEAQSAEGSPTVSLITYLSRLLDERLIGDDHLVRFSVGLERGEVVNPILEEDAAANYSLLVQRGGLEHLIQSDKLNQEMLLRWTQEKLSERGMVRQQRNVIHKDTEISAHPMNFVPIQAGTFMMGEVGKKKEVAIKDPYEMSVFSITQWQWAMIMGENPSHFSDGSESIEIEIRGRQIRMQPNHPVERVRWGDTQKFIKKLNELSKLDDAFIYKVISDHLKGRKYRLPKEAEWERAVRAGTDTEYSFGEGQALLGKYAWFDENSNHVTHAVGLKRPNPWGLYDMHGNVWEWCFENTVAAGHILRGGSWHHFGSGLRSAYCEYGEARYHSSDVGFRIVRVKLK
ncbi:MAG: hypothetical protein A3B70_03210 [Deltaproteobacteria bacterium RIFCSPHIGHO2_02_FULL_40_11]|nr:MAG: hypothetical protein A3B70_03210 [Deltaproteobacteria bacterium RIFCSPHIGHO2_02_FULL_40_11]